MSRVVLATFGSHGDLNPYIAIGKALVARGAAVTVAAASAYEPTIRRHGLSFHPMRPEVDLNDEEIYRKVLDPWRGAEFLNKDFLIPRVSESYEDLVAACADADVLVSHVLVYAGRVVAEKLGIPWVMPVLQPMAFFSIHEMPIIQPVTFLKHLRPLGPSFCGLLKRAMFSVSSSWGEPVRQLRKDSGLDAGPDPVSEALFSPHGVLAMFPSSFGKAQPDWPNPTVRCDFPFLDEDFEGARPSRELEQFLQRGDPPTVFTLGSAAVKVAPWFFRAALEASAGRRIVLVAGDAAPKLSSENLHPDVLVVRSAPYHWLFPRASTIVHSGGIGTTGQALRSGQPQVVVPFAHDQFDNAERVQGMGCGISLPKHHARRPRRLEAAVKAARRLSEPAREVSRSVSEQGAERAADAVLSSLAVYPKS